MKVEITSVPNSYGMFDKWKSNSNVNNNNENSSLPNVATSLKPIERKYANLEAEKGEYAINSDQSLIYKILGKPHSQGGTPLNLEKNSFIFSKDRSLAIPKETQKIFGFKLGGSIKKIDNTPAKILERNINIKHNNQMKVMLEDEKIRDIASKNTAKLMLAKNQKKLGQIAFLQESKKNFINGIPSFSENTQPIYSQEIKNKITTKKQYMKEGGYVPKYKLAGQVKCPEGYYLDTLSNTCLPMPNFTEKPIVNTENNPLYYNELDATYKGYYPHEIIQSDWFSNSYTPNKNNIPYINGRPIGTQHAVNNTNYSVNDEFANTYRNNWDNMMRKLYPERFSNNEHHQVIYNSLLDDKFNPNPVKTGEKIQNNKYSYDYSDKSNLTVDFQNGLIQNSDRYGKQSIPIGKPGQINMTEFFNLPYDKQVEKAKFLDLTVEDLIKAIKNDPLSPIINTGVQNNTVTDNKNKSLITIELPKFNNPEGVYTNQKVPFNTGQIASIVGTAALAGMRKDIYPQRAENTFVPIELEKTNANTQLQNNANSQLASARLAAIIGLSPTQSAAYLQKATSEGLSQSAQILDKYDTQNVGIANQQNEYNNKEFNTLRSQNVALNQDYINKVNLTLGRSNEEKINNNTNLLNLGLGYYAQNQAMQHQLNTLEQYPVYDPKTGKPVLDEYGRQKHNTVYSPDYNGNYIFNNVNGMDVNFKKNNSKDYLDEEIANIDKQIDAESDLTRKSLLLHDRLTLILSRAKNNKKYGGFLNQLINK